MAIMYQPQHQILPKPATQRFPDIQPYPVVGRCVASPSLSGEPERGASNDNGLADAENNDDSTH